MAQQFQYCYWEKPPMSTQKIKLPWQPASELRLVQTNTGNAANVRCYEDSQLKSQQLFIKYENVFHSLGKLTGVHIDKSVKTSLTEAPKNSISSIQENWGWTWVIRETWYHWRHRGTYSMGISVGHEKQTKKPWPSSLMHGHERSKQSHHV